MCRRWGILLVREVWLKYIIDTDVHFIDYLYVMDPANARKMEHIKTSKRSAVLII